MEQEEQEKSEVKKTGRRGLLITTTKKAKPSIFTASYQIRSNVFNLMERHDQLPSHLSFFFLGISLVGLWIWLEG